MLAFMIDGQGVTRVIAIPTPQPVVYIAHVVRPVLSHNIYDYVDPVVTKVEFKRVGMVMQDVAMYESDRVVFNMEAR